MTRKDVGDLQGEEVAVSRDHAKALIVHTIRGRLDVCIEHRVDDSSTLSCAEESLSERHLPVARGKVAVVFDAVASRRRTRLFHHAHIFAKLLHSAYVFLLVPLPLVKRCSVMNRWGGKSVCMQLAAVEWLLLAKTSVEHNNELYAGRVKRRCKPVCLLLDELVVPVMAPVAPGVCLDGPYDRAPVHDNLSPLVSAHQVDPARLVPHPLNARKEPPKRP